MTRLALLLSLMQLAIGSVGPLPPPTAPAGLHVQLRTVANRTTFRLSEIVPLEVAFRSSGPSPYSIELADKWNAAPATDRFLVEPSESVIDRHVWWLEGIVCCNSRRALLTSTSSVYSHELTDVLRFTEPGEYRIQYSTRRVFRGMPAVGYEPSDMLVRSNVILIRIIEDDPRWLYEVLRAALAGVKTPPPIKERQGYPPLPLRDSLQPARASDAMIRYRNAARQLRMLDTPEAIRARVAGIQLPSVDEWRRTEATGDGYSGVDGSVAYSGRPDLVAAALGERASAPDFGVVRGYFDVWVRVLLERDHPTLVRLNRPRDTRAGETLDEWDRVARQGLLDTLRELNRSKTGVAAEITGATVRQEERALARR